MDKNECVLLGASKLHSDSLAGVSIVNGQYIESFSLRTFVQSTRIQNFAKFKICLPPIVKLEISPSSHVSGEYTKEK